MLSKSLCANACHCNVADVFPVSSVAFQESQTNIWMRQGGGNINTAKRQDFRVQAPLNRLIAWLGLFFQ